MPVSSELQNGILLVTVVGDYANDELVGAITRGYKDPSFTATTPVLIDGRRSSAAPNSQDVQHISRRIVGQRPAGHTGKWAIITSTEPLRFGVGRMASLTMESMGVPVEVFTDPDAALKYVKS